MRKRRLLPTIAKNIDKTLSGLYYNKQAPAWTFVFLLCLYALTLFFLMTITKSQSTISIFGTPVRVNTFAGVFSSLANICVILLVVFCRKRGFITALLILICQFPILGVQLFKLHRTATIPGAFTNLFTIIACGIIYVNKTMVEKYQKNSHYQAITDSLTGLPNRFACTELMESFIKSGVNFVLVSIDLNNFKNINDIMGHEIGNKVLSEIAYRWRVLADARKTKTVDFVARLGGDEFALVIMGYNSPADVADTIKSYKKKLEETITIDNCDYFMTACFGCAEFPDDAQDTTSLFSCADAALHEIKRLNSSNCILRFSNNLLKTEQNLEIERKLRTALDSDSILFFLQPQYDASHKLLGFEALARIKDTDDSFMRPDEFIPVAEKTGLIDRVDIDVFRKAACFLGEILKKTDTNITISTNISVRHLMKNNFIDEIKDVLSTSGVPADRFEIEITESIMIDSAEKALQRINDVKKLGIKVAIDDFGTGFSSLSYLNKFPADSLKIDKSFIDVMNSNDSTKQYVAAIISIGHTLNLKVISEGVEIPEQLETLKNIGCDCIQGFLWGRPMPPEEAAKLI
ncbi:MAG: bifunctional diguanylate cyclase/phosphodiesterase [Spirochaetaceae bacterium]|nr:bifunctional diguanylate cyclase/phosphodiesterase [Spirochaetaceae bacterium]